MVCGLLAEATTHPGVWLPYGSPGEAYQSLVRAAIFFPGILLAAGIVFYLTRGFLSRFRLKTAYIVAAVTIAFYAAAFAYRPGQFALDNEPVVFWIHRLAGALLLFSFLRVVDRLALVPLLTRGGKIPLSRFVHQIINIVLFLFAILIFGSVAFGWNIDRFLAGSAVVSIVLGLALQETLGNFFSGLVMQASPPFTLGNWIVCGTHEGRVVDMTWRAVTLHTDDGNFILIPNATVAKAEIINYNAPTVLNARIVKVGLEYSVPPLDAIAVLEAAATEAEGVQPEPAPDARVLEFGDSAIIYKIKFWIDNPKQHDEIEHFVRQSIWYRLKEKGYNIPFPIRTVEYVSLDKKVQRETEQAVAERLEALGKVPFLRSLSSEQKLQLARTASDVTLAPGQVLFKQNDAGDSFYIVVRGAVDVLVNDAKNPSAPATRVATLGPGEFFGEMSALTGQPRTATIRASSHLVAIQVEKGDLMQVFEADPGIMEAVSTLVARRNAEREALQAGAGAAPAELVATQSRSLLSRMRAFFRL